MQCRKIENFLSLRKRNGLPQPHASNADRLNEPLLEQNKAMIEAQRGIRDENRQKTKLVLYLTKRAEGVRPFGGRAAALFTAVHFRHSDHFRRRPHHFRRRLDRRVHRKKFITVFDQDLDDLIAELDVHDGGHGLLARPQKRRAEADADVGRCHLFQRKLLSKLI